MYYVYNGFYVFDFIAYCWATFSALCALLSSHIMTNKMVMMMMMVHSLLSCNVNIIDVSAVIKLFD